MKSILIFFIVLILSSMSYAKDIYGPPPVDLLLFETNKIYEGEARINEHGLKEYCYEIEGMYVVYSNNLLGEGYSFLDEKPDQNCIVPEGEINRVNKLGLTTGISQKQASLLLGFEIVDGDNEITWHYKRPIRNLPYDDQTTLNIKIKNGKVYAISLFNTVTN